MRVLVSGGGTGGHISPVLAVITELNKLDKTVEILYVGSDDGLESKIIPQAGYNFKGIRTGKFRRYHQSLILNIIDPSTLFKNSRDLFRFFSGYFEAKRIVAEFDPDVVFCKGGYVSLPVGFAAHSLGYPLVVHESDSIMGLSNKLLSERADRVCVSYPKKNFPEIKNQKALVLTGNPVREDIFAGNKSRAIENFDLTNSLPVLLIIGGSQGALIINKVVAESLPKLLSKYQIIHISGERDYDWLSYRSEKLPEDLKKNYHLYNFLSGNLKDAYAVSDLVVSRAGNNVIAELAALSKPTILIPITSSANNHQVNNAKILARQGASILIMEQSLSPEVLQRKINYLFESPEELKDMGRKILDVAMPNGAQKVAAEIYDLAATSVSGAKLNDEAAE